MKRERSSSTHPERSGPDPAQPARRVAWPIALILGGVVLTLGWTAFLGWIVYATVLWTIG
jgi:hypothetical protein